MFTQLTTEHCLYVINEKLLKIFVRCSEQHFIKGYVSTAISLEQLNNYAAVLQIWCMLNEDKLRLIMNPEKMLSYSIDYYILKLLRTDPKIQLFLKQRTLNHQEKFFIAYHLACATLQWFKEVHAQYEEGQHLLAINRAQDYFTLFKTENLTQAEDHEFYYLQKTSLQMISRDYNSTERWNESIGEALQSIRIKNRVSSNTSVFAN